MPKCSCGNEADDIGIPVDICKECYDRIVGEAEAAFDDPHPEDGLQTDVIYEAISIKPGNPKSDSMVVKRYRDDKDRRVIHFICQCTSAHAPGKDAGLIAEALNEHHERRKPGRVIFETAQEAIDAATQEGFGMVYLGTTRESWIKLSDWDLKMKGFKSPHYLRAGNRLYRITACYHLGYDHSKKGGGETDEKAASRR